jgi:tRNA threonylcarbamoyladenosine biosynthesis protein TsaE
MTAPTSISASAEQTERLGAELASQLSGGDVVLISGDLGAGKTTFVRGACRALGVEEPVTSPTFTIGRTYRGDRIGISHLDLYRLESLEGEDPALLDDYLGAERIAFIEWPPEGREADRLPVEGDLRTVTIEALLDGSRRLEIR